MKSLLYYIVCTFFPLSFDGKAQDEHSAKQLLQCSMEFKGLERRIK